MLLDIKIIFKTIATVLKRENVYTNDESVKAKAEEERVPQEADK